MVIDSRCFVVEEGANPSSDFFVLPFLRDKGFTILRRSFSEVPSAGDLDGATVVFVRYVPANWKSLVERHRDKFAEVYFFIDDDLFDWRTFAVMPLRYQFKLLRYSWSKQAWLKSVGARLLVSTPFLQQKYATWQPQLLKPRAVKPATQPALQTRFYHGSASHSADLRWLYPVVEEVLTRNEQLVFEVIGDGQVNRLFKQLPRTHIIHPMKWPAYQALICRTGRSIGLAPLLPSPFNAARSHTKFFDITQAGAVGVYAQGPVYEAIVEHGYNGLLVPMEQSAWVDAVLSLAGDAELRARLYEKARACF